MSTPPLISFIGWHNSGKTTLAARVVARLAEQGFAVCVIKSTKETGIELDTPGTDTHTYARAGAQSVALVAPDQLMLRTTVPVRDLLLLAARYGDRADLVVAEGFKHTSEVPKIEVHRQGSDYLHLQVDNVVAVVSDEPVQGLPHFSTEQTDEMAAFILRFLQLD